MRIEGEGTGDRGEREKGQIYSVSYVYFPPFRFGRFFEQVELCALSFVHLSKKQHHALRSAHSRTGLWRHGYQANRPYCLHCQGECICTGGAVYRRRTLGSSDTVCGRVCACAQVTMTMPYYDFTQPITAWYDEANGLGRMDYFYGTGMCMCVCVCVWWALYSHLCVCVCVCCADTYIYNSSGEAYQIVPIRCAHRHGAWCDVISALPTRVRVCVMRQQ